MPTKSKQSKSDKDLEVAVSALNYIANAGNYEHSHEATVITSVGKASEVAKSALDEIGKDE